MPHYYFKTNDGETSIADDVGLELVSLEAASLQVHSALAEMATDAKPSVGTTRMMVVLVEDQTGKVVLRGALSILVEQMP
jgi:hypothetical protein